MTTQSTLFGQARAPRRPLATLGRACSAFAGFVVYWMPVWVPLAILAQVALRGLRPAMTEQERLLKAETEVVERHERVTTRFEAMRDEAEAWRDPVYRERLRRARED